MALPSFLTGIASDKDFNAAPKVTGIDPKTWAIDGQDEFEDASEGNVNTLKSMTQPQFQPELTQSADLMNYFGGVAKGTQQTAADALLQRASAQNAAQNQSAVLAGQGQTGAALGLRNLQNANQQNQGNIAGMAAQQKLQQQFMGAQQSQSLIQQRIAAQQQTYENAVNNIKIQQDIQGGLFDASSRAASFRAEGAKNDQALQMYNRNQALARLDQKAQASNKLFTGLLKAGATAGAAALTGGASLGVKGATGVFGKTGYNAPLSGGEDEPESLDALQAGKRFALNFGGKL